MSRGTGEQMCRACGATIRAATGSEPLARFCPMCGCRLDTRGSPPQIAPAPIIPPAEAKGTAGPGPSMPVVPPSPAALGMPPRNRPPASAPSQPAISMRRCAYCQSAIEPNDDVVGCPYCSQPHHAECWRENGGCTVYACRGQNQFPAAHRTQPAPQPTHGTSLAPATVPAPRWQAVGTSGQRRISRSASEALFFGVIAFLFSFFGVGLVFGPVAVHKGLKALREMARDRQLRGQARAWTGQVMGGLGALVSLLILLNFLGCTR